MTTVLHQVWKDVRRYARWLLAWAVVCVLPLAVLLVPDDARMAHAALTTLAPMLRFVVFLVVTILVVQEDPLVGTTAFWLTRPIGWRALFASKLLFVVGLLALPATAVDIAHTAAAGVGLPYVLLAIPEIALDWGVWAIGVLALAALGTTLPGFLATALQVYLVWGAAFWLVVAARGVAHGRSLGDALMLRIGGAIAPMFEPGADPQRLAPSWVASRTLATFALVALGALGVATIQYRTRRRGLAWAALAAGLVVIVALREDWRWDFFGLPPLEISTPVRTDAGVRLSLESSGRLESSAMMPGQGAPDRKMIYAGVRIEGLVPPLAAEIERLDGSLTFADGSRLPLVGRPPIFAAPRWNARAVEALLDGARFVNFEQEGATRALLLNVDAGDFARHAGQEGHLDGSTVMTVREYHLVAVLPLRPGSTYDGGIERAVLTRVQDASGDCSVIMRETEVSLLLAPNPHGYRMFATAWINPDVLYVLRNRARGEAFWPQFGTTVGFAWPSGARVRDITATATYRSNVAGDPVLPLIDDAWLAGAELVRFEAEARETIGTSIPASRFVMPGEAATGARR